MSKLNDILQEAAKVGYKVTQNGEVYSHKGNLLKPGKQSNGYPKFTFFSKIYGKHIVLIHRLQAFQKFGDKIFEPGIQVRHLNGNPLDNSWDNIEIGSVSDNQLDISEEVRLKRSHKAGVEAAKVTRSLTEEKVKELREAWESGASTRSLSRDHDIPLSTVRGVIHRKTYKNVT